jgi:hypothetical protein
MATQTHLGWQPKQTWVFVVGTLEWKHSEMFDSFPKEQRRDAALVRWFQQVGVPDAQIVYLQDRRATYKQIQATLTEFLPKAAAGDLLFFYYCGHGYQLDSGVACLTPYDCGDDGTPDWEMEAVPVLINRLFGGTRAVLAADCCFSGNLAASLTKHKGRVSFACLTSSSASEVSTGNWTFTETLAAGLSGQAFTDSDGSATITLRELADEILGDMAFAEEQLASFAITGSFDPNMVIAAARPKPAASVGRRIEVRSDGEWYKARIIDADGDQSLVHYYGWEASDDEWVTSDQIRNVTPVQYQPGSKVEVRWKGDWYPATILELRGGVHYIAYDDEGEEWNEWVASKRIRKPQ